MEWMLLPYRRYAEFSGRSRRKEFWMFVLFMAIVETVLLIPLFAAGFSMLMAIGQGGNEASALASFGPVAWVSGGLLVVWVLASIIPYLAVTVRRLHDRDMSGWYLLGFFVLDGVAAQLGRFGSLVSLALNIAFIVVMALPGTPGTNSYGPDPLGQVDPEVFA